MSERNGMVWMYPIASGAGLADKAQGCWIPANLVPKFERNGTWSRTPNFENPNVTKSIVAKAQEEIAQQRAEIEADKLQLKKMMEEWAAQQQAAKSDTELKIKKVKEV